MMIKLFTSLKISAAILLAVMGLGHLRSAHADDPAYYKLTEVEELTIYKENDNELRPTFSFETVGFGQINPGWGKRTSSYGEFGRHWFELAVTPGLEGSLGLGGYGKLFARLSGVYTFTGGGLDGPGTNPPPNTHPSRFLLEDAHLRWTSGDLMPFFGKDGVEVSAGAQRFRPVGSGFLVWGGSQNGGRRGAFWLGARRAFENTGVLRLRKDAFRGDFFYLTPNDDPDTNTDVIGTNLEYDITKTSQIGFMYLNVLNSDRVRRDGLNVFNFRGKTAPFSSLPGLQFDGELALEENGNQVKSALGGYAGVGYEFAELPWKPRISYRYAGFSGNRRGKTPNKAFDPLFYGQSDWGTWFQGEILGNWVLINQNLLSHLIRLELRPVESLTLNLLYFHFRLAHLTTTEVSRDGVIHTVNVDSKNLGDEVNLAADWMVNKHLVFTGVYGFNVPGQAARQFTGGSKVWNSFMLYMGVRL
jgi:Alginate export